MVVIKSRFAALLVKQHHPGVLLLHTRTTLWSELHLPCTPGAGGRQSCGWKQQWASAAVPLHREVGEEEEESWGKMHEEEDGRDASPAAAPRFTAARSVDVAEEQASRLCGYLNKLSGKGPLRGYKPRWFVYDPRKCYLYYFKTPQDGLPLGHIEVGDACFCYDVEAEEGRFEIRTAGKEFLLKVGAEGVMAPGCDEAVRLWFLTSSSEWGETDTPIHTGHSHLVSHHIV